MSTATAMLAFYIDAEPKILAGQSVRFGDRSLTRADLAEVRRGRLEWEQRVAAEQAAQRGQSSLYSVANFRDR